MAYVPGSCKAGRLRVVDITHGTDPYDILNDPALGGAKLETVEVPAGSVIWHHGLTIHAAYPNKSTRPRRVFTIVSISATAKRQREWIAYPLDRDSVAVGEVIQGPGMPVLWPAPAGTAQGRWRACWAAGQTAGGRCSSAVTSKYLRRGKYIDVMHHNHSSG